MSVISTKTDPKPRSAVIDQLAAQIKATRDARQAGRPSEWVRTLQHVPDERLAVIVAEAILRYRAKPATVVTVAKDLRDMLPELKTIDVALKLLDVAVVAGLLHADQWEPLPSPGSGKKPAPRTLRLSDQAIADGVQLRLLTEQISPARPVKDRAAPDMRRAIHRNRTGWDETPQVSDVRVVSAYDAIQSTPFRINQRILKALQHYGDATPTLIESAEREGIDKFYYRNFFDWRGRIYPQGSELVYTGPDTARALLEFGEGQKINAQGWLTLAKHITACWGFDDVDKGTSEDRIKWVQAQFADSYGPSTGFNSWAARCARDPFKFQKWRDAKHRYKFLAAIQAWADAQAGKRVHLPCAQDATCSGLQHYALLMRDFELAEMVNVADGARQDFYKLIADAIGNGIERKTVKEIVVPFIYGAGAIETAVLTGYDADQVRAVQREAARYAPAFVALQKWLKQVASAHFKAGRPVLWTLPDGFTVLHDERVQTGRLIKTWVHSFAAKDAKTGKRRGFRNLTVRELVSTEALDRNEQRAGIAPNFIHSWDAALLRDIVRRGKARGIEQWALAHDSFGVLPNDGMAVQALYREAVQALYGPDRLGELATVWARDGVTVPLVPGRRVDLPVGFNHSVFSTG